MSKLSKDQLERLQAEKKKRDKAKLSQCSLREFIELVKPDWEWHPHVEKIVENLERIAEGKQPRTIICVPPRSGKSTLVSQIFPAWLAIRFPGRKVGIASYSSEQAVNHGELSKQFFLFAGGSLNRLKTAKDDWQTVDGSRIWARGLDAGMLGLGYDVGIVDDPTANMVKTESITEMENLLSQYSSTFETRADVFGQKGFPPSIIVVMQRLATNDLVGQLLARDFIDKWHVVCLQAIKDETAITLPEECTLEPDWREPGEALVPELQSYYVERRLKDPVGFQAQYQQRPLSDQDLIITRDKFQILSPELIPSFTRTLRAWDIAITKGSDYSVGALIGFDQEENIYILDLLRGKMEGPEVKSTIIDYAISDGITNTTVVEDSGIAKYLVQELYADKLFQGARELKSINMSKVQGNLTLRSKGVFNQIYAGKLFLKEASWNKTFIDEFLTFNGSKNGTDDIIAAVSVGYLHFVATLKRGFTAIKDEVPLNPFSYQALEQFCFGYLQKKRFYHKR